LLSSHLSHGTISCPNYICRNTLTTPPAYAPSLKLLCPTSTTSPLPGCATRGGSLCLRCRILQGASQATFVATFVSSLTSHICWSLTSHICFKHVEGLAMLCLRLSVRNSLPMPCAMSRATCGVTRACGVMTQVKIWCTMSRATCMWQLRCIAQMGFSCDSLAMNPARCPINYH